MVLYLARHHPFNQISPWYLSIVSSTSYNFACFMSHGSCLLLGKYNVIVQLEAHGFRENHLAEERVFLFFSFFLWDGEKRWRADWGLCASQNNNKAVLIWFATDELPVRIECFVGRCIYCRPVCINYWSHKKGLATESGWVCVYLHDRPGFTDGDKSKVADSSTVFLLQGRLLISVHLCLAWKARGVLQTSESASSRRHSEDC